MICIPNESSWHFPSNATTLVTLCVKILSKNQFWHTTGGAHNGAGSQETSSRPAEWSTTPQYAYQTLSVAEIMEEKVFLVSQSPDLSSDLATCPRMAIAPH